MSDPLVAIRGVKRSFESGRVQALRGVDLEIGRGEFVSITGPSGSGKSTLLNLIGAMDLPDEGEIVVDGVRLVDDRSLECVRAEKIGFVFQRFNLLPTLNAVENVEIPLVGRNGASRRERRERGLALLEQVGLAERAGSGVRGLSGGERQRVAIARAMIHEPMLILADEPTGNLDSKTGHEVMGVLHDLRRRTGATLVLVTHDLEICQGADRRFDLHDGRLA